jgi:hypothetical protein
VQILKRVLYSLAAIWLIATIALYVYQDELIFRYKKLPADYHFTFDQPYEEFFLPTRGEDSLNLLLFKSPTPAKGLVLYFHGNASNLQRWGNYAVDFTKIGYDVLMLDFRGYGKSTGTPTEVQLYADALLLWDWVKNKYPDTHIIVYGRSLGSAIAAKLASLRPADQLILETPFDQLRGAVPLPLQWPLYVLPLDHQFPTYEVMHLVYCPVTIIHGTNDWVVPLSSAQRLQPFLKETDQFITIEGGGHRNLRDFPAYHEALAKTLH